MGGDDPESASSRNGPGVPKRTSSAFKVMTIMRSYTAEGDFLLNHLETGIFDALQRQYLRSFIFAIYLDEKDPNNIVEAYTFNFNYFQIPGTDQSIPIMTLHESLTNMNLDGKTTKKHRDPIAEAAKNGKLPTVGEVKRSVKALIKRLIQATTSMEALPKRRYATFKLFYNDNTPDDYEPPHFEAGDVDKDRWYFATGSTEQVPERTNVGKLNTGHHSVSVSITSVAPFLPTSTEENDIAFTGLTTKQNVAPVQDDLEALQKDAESRNVVWSAEGSLSEPNGEGEVDPDVEVRPQPTHAGSNATDEDLLKVPIGIRNKEGAIVPLAEEVSNLRIATAVNDSEQEQSSGGENEEPIRGKIYGGGFQLYPEDVEEHIISSMARNEILPMTQAFIDSQEPQDQSRSFYNASPAPPRAGPSRWDSLPPSDFSASQEEYVLGTETQELRDMLPDTFGDHDSDMIDMETQPAHYSRVELDQIAEDAIDGVLTPLGTSTPRAQTPVQAAPAAEVAVADVVDEDMPAVVPAAESLFDEDMPPVSAPERPVGVLECECGLETDEPCCFCDGGCERWYHAWCMGYESANDERFPDKFVCFDCRVRQDQNWPLMENELYPRMLTKYKDLALFRLAIKVAEKHNPENASAFAKKILCEPAVAVQLFKRLEAENFIAEESTTTDDIGLLSTKGKAKAKPKGRQRKNMQKTKYSFNTRSLTSAAYRDYFDPKPATESRLIGLDELTDVFQRVARQASKAAKVARKSAASGSQLPTVEDIEMDSQSVPAGNNTISQTLDETEEQPDIDMPPVLSQSRESPKRRSDEMEAESQTPPRKRVKISVTRAVDLCD